MSESNLISRVFEGKTVRVVVKNGEPWFVAKDACDVLGITNPSTSMENFPENEILKIRSTEVSTSREQGKWGGASSFLTVNEPGLYRLIFQSRKREAEAFKTWVFTEVLPDIRRTGRYDIRDYADFVRPLTGICDKAYAIISRCKTNGKPPGGKDSALLVEQAEILRKAVYKALMISDALVLKVEAMERHTLEGKSRQQEITAEREQGKITD
jgi:prophage antirepressor-like protein